MMGNDQIFEPWRTASYWEKALVMALPAIMLGLQIAGWIFFLPGAMQGHSDFRHLYAAAYMIRTGHSSELYDYDAQQKFQNQLVSPEAIALPFNHLAYESLFFVPYSFLSYRAGYFLFLLTNVLLLVFAARTMGMWIGNLRTIARWLPSVLFFTFLPTAAALMQGQDSILLLLLFAGTFTLLGGGQQFVPGFLVGLGLFKFQVVVPVVVLLFVWRRWRFVGGFACSTALGLLISLLLVGPSQMTTFAHSLLSMSVKETVLDQARFAVFPIEMPNLRGLIYALTRSILPMFWIQAITAVTSLGVLLWIALKGNTRSSHLQLPLAITAAAVLSYHLFSHDLAILLIPICLGLNQYFDLDPASDAVSAAACAVMFASPAVIGLSSVSPSVLAIPLIFFLASQARTTSAASLGSESTQNRT